MNRQVQFVIVTMDDGEKYQFAGEAVLYPNEKRKITNVNFTEPRDIPDGYTFEPIKGEKNEHRKS